MLVRGDTNQNHEPKPRTKTYADFLNCPRQPAIKYKSCSLIWTGFFYELVREDMNQDNEPKPRTKTQ